MAFALLPARLTRWEKPARRGRVPQHREADRVALLEFKLAGANMLIASQHMQLAEISDSHTETVRDLEAKLAEARQFQAEAELVVVCQQADIDDLKAERDALAEEVAGLKTMFGPQLAEEANANAITVPIAIRDTSDPEDQATAPIDVRPLWEARDAGLLDTTQPQHVPAWATRD